MRSIASFTLILALGIGSSVPALAGGGDARARLACSASGAQDFSMDARYEAGRGRIKFDASFEAAPGLGFEPGDVLAVIVGGVQVGSLLLVRAPNGDVEGDLGLDTTAQANDDDLPFPADFPGVTAGTSVVVGAIGCALF